MNPRAVSNALNLVHAVYTARNLETVRLRGGQTHSLSFGGGLHCRRICAIPSRCFPFNLTGDRRKKAWGKGISLPLLQPRRPILRHKFIGGSLIIDHAAVSPPPSLRPSLTQHPATPQPADPSIPREPPNNGLHTSNSNHTSNPKSSETGTPPSPSRKPSSPDARVVDQETLSLAPTPPSFTFRQPFPSLSATAHDHPETHGPRDLSDDTPERAG